MNRLTPKQKLRQQIEKLEQAMHHQRALYAQLNGQHNPQIVEVRARLLGKADAYEAALQALRGSSTLLDMDAQ